MTALNPIPVYLFACPKPDAHFGYGHSFEMCYHMVDGDDIADRAFVNYTSNGESLYASVVDAIRSFQAEVEEKL